MKYIFLVPIILALIIFAPFITVWAIHTLFDVPAVYDFWHWLAVILIGSGPVINRYANKD